MFKCFICTQQRQNTSGVIYFIFCKCDVVVRLLQHYFLIRNLICMKIESLLLLSTVLEFIHGHSIPKNKNLLIYQKHFQKKNIILNLMSILKVCRVFICVQMCGFCVVVITYTLNKWTALFPKKGRNCESRAKEFCLLYIKTVK